MMKQEWSDNLKSVQTMNEKELEKKQALVNQLEGYWFPMILRILSIVLGY